MSSAPVNPYPTIHTEPNNHSQRSNSLTSASISSRRTICSETSTANLLSYQKVQIGCSSKAQSILGIEEGDARSELSGSRLTSNERSRVLRSTVKLSRILGEALDEEVVKQWVVAPKKADACYRCNQSTMELDSIELDSAPELEAEIPLYQTDFGLEQSGCSRPPSFVGQENDSAYTPAEKRTTVKRTAKLFSLLGERIYVYSPTYRSAQLHLNALERPDDKFQTGVGFQEQGRVQGRVQVVSYFERRFRNGFRKLAVSGQIEGGRASSWLP
jgi:hypothetical protein